MTSAQPVEKAGLNKETGFLSKKSYQQREVEENL